MPRPWVVAELRTDICSCHSSLQVALCQQQLPEQRAAAATAAAALLPAQEAEQQQGKLFVQRAPPVLEQAAMLCERLQALVGAMQQGLPAMLALQQALQTAVNHLQVGCCLHCMKALVHQGAAAWATETCCKAFWMGVCATCLTSGASQQQGIQTQIIEVQWRTCVSHTC